MATRRTSSTDALSLAIACVAMAAAACDRPSDVSPAAPPREVAASEDTSPALRADADTERIAELQREIDSLREQLRLRDVALRSAAARSCEELECEVAGLTAELIDAQEQRLNREREWLRYTEALRTIPVAAVADEDQFKPQVPGEKLQQPPAEPPPIDDATAARCAAIARSLRTLLAIEGVRGIDLLEAGELHEGAIGPVVFRLLDERGRLAGSLCAKRLRLEGSRSARTLTVVLEDGYESRGGERTEFPHDISIDGAPESIGIRRLAFPDIDPMPWVEAVPELFGGAVLDDPRDDGVWNRDFVRVALNQLLRIDTAHGYWRVKSLGGIQGVTLRDVHLEGFDKAGKLERHLFADRMTLVREEKGAMLLLEDGAQARGNEKTAFLDGRFRIYLPRAAHSEWEAAGLPGWSAPPEAPSNAHEEASRPKTGPGSH